VDYITPVGVNQLHNFKVRSCLPLLL